MQDGICKSADEPLVDNNNLSCIEDLSSIAAVKSQPAAVSMDDVILPAVESSAESCDSRIVSDVEQCSDADSDTVNMSIPVLTSSHVSPRKYCNYVSSAERPLLTPVHDFSHTIQTVIGKSGRKPSVTKCSKHRSLSHLVKSTSDLDQASPTLVPSCTDCDISTLIPGTLSDSLTVLAPEPLAAEETVCPLPSLSVSASTSDLAYKF